MLYNDFCLCLHWLYIGVASCSEETFKSQKSVTAKAGSGKNNAETFQINIFYWKFKTQFILIFKKLFIVF
jgi:hypothetical protein